MQTHFKFKHSGATIKLPTNTIVDNWLQSINKPMHHTNQSEQFARIGELLEHRGGIYAGIARGENSESDYYLIVAPGKEGEQDSLPWGNSGEKIANTDHEWDGQANTAALVKDPHDHPAAEWAHNLTLNGKSDWYLPARRELALCYANVPEVFAKEWHWSSTQYSAYYAWGQTFGIGSQYDGLHENGLGRCRAVRRFFTDLSI